jgi:hypothetical protein
MTGAGAPHGIQLEDPMNKSILLSKTFWVQVASVLSLLVPAVNEWLKANPVEFVAALAALNILVRFVTSGKVSLTGDDSSSSGTSVLLFVAAGIAGTAAVGTLPSCSPAQIEAMRRTPIRACVVTEQGRICYSAKDGLSAEIDATK